MSQRKQNKKLDDLKSFRISFLIDDKGMAGRYIRPGKGWDELDAKKRIKEKYKKFDIYGIEIIK